MPPDPAVWVRTDPRYAMRRLARTRCKPVVSLQSHLIVRVCGRKC
jgi:hypothetical protein